MNSIVEAFHMGGAGMYLLLLLALFTHAGAVACIAIAAASKSRKTLVRISVATLVVTGLAVLVGITFYMGGMSNVNEAVQFAAPDQREALRAMGHHEASMLLYGTACATVLPLLAGVGGLVRGLLTGDSASPG